MAIFTPEQHDRFGTIFVLLGLVAILSSPFTAAYMVTNGEELSTVMDHERLSPALRGGFLGLIQLVVGIGVFEFGMRKKYD